MNDALVSQTTAPAIVTPPNAAPAGGWDAFELNICPTNPSAACFKQTCNNKPNPPPQTSACDLTGLSPSTDYSVTATAMKSGAAPSQTSPAAAFRTRDPRPPPQE